MNYIIVFFISMVPLIELRGSILYATGVGLPFLPAYISGDQISLLSADFSVFVLRKARRAARSFRPRQAGDFLWHCFCL